MTFPVFLIQDSGIASIEVGDSFVIGGSEARHAVTVRRLGVGDRLQVVDGFGWRVLAIIESVVFESFTVRLLEKKYEPARMPSIVLVQALVKGGREERAIEASVELGVDTIFPWQAQRSIVKWDRNSRKGGVKKWENLAVSATKQSARARLPILKTVGTTKELLLQFANEGNLILVLHEISDQKLVEVDFPDTLKEVVVFVGPEGGISPEEIKLFQEFGAFPVVLGSEVLRSATASIAALTYLNVVLSRWS